MRVGIAAMGACAAAAPTMALASVHADLGSSGVLNVLLALLASAAVFVRFATPLLLVAAAYLFWKKDLGGWLFSCVAVPAAMSLLTQSFVAFGNQGAGIAQTMLALQWVYLAAYSFLFVVAVRAAPAPRADAA